MNSIQSSTLGRAFQQSKTNHFIFLTFSMLHLTKSQVLGSDYWVEGLHVRGVDDDRMLCGATLGRQARPGLIPVVADKSKTEVRLPSQLIRVKRHRLVARSVTTHSQTRFTCQMFWRIFLPPLPQSLFPRENRKLQLQAAYSWSQRQGGGITEVLTLTLTHSFSSTSID